MTVDQYVKVETLNIMIMLLNFPTAEEYVEKFNWFYEKLKVTTKRGTSRQSVKKKEVEKLDKIPYYVV